MDYELRDEPSMNVFETNLHVKFVVENNRVNIELYTNDDLNKKQMLNILTGGLALVIRSEESPKTQGEMMSDVVKYLESELINIDSFSDAYFYKKNITKE